MNPDALIGPACTWAAGVAAAYLVVGAVIRLAARRPVIRRALTVGVALALTGGGVAAATPGRADAVRRPGVSADWPTGTGSRGPRPVVVRPGDCLWDIAGRHLDRPTAQRIASWWPRWWRRNRRVIGANPDLVRPGQRLRPPVPRSSS